MRDPHSDPGRWSEREEEESRAASTESTTSPSSIFPQSSGQKLNTPANQICRWPVLELIWPNALDVTVVFGLPKCGVFVAPNHSVRNWKFTRSVSLKVRKRLASRLKMPGPPRYGKLRPVLPN